MNDLVAALSTRPLVADAGMGTRLIARGLDLRHDDPALWNLSHPEIVQTLHAAHVAAGADVLLTNTFGANRARLVTLGREASLAEVNRAAVELARGASRTGQLVLGDVGPDAAHDREILLEQAHFLLDAGVDGLILETCTQEMAHNALSWLREVSEIPIVVSLMGGPWNETTVECMADWAAVCERAGASALGTNCGTVESVGVELLALGRLGAMPLIAKPSALLRPGVPCEPDTLAQHVPSWLQAGARLVGGCCGTTEAHVAAVRGAVDRWLAQVRAVASGQAVNI